MKKYNAFIFDGDNTPATQDVNYTITTQDIAPEISIDLAYGLKDSVRKLREALGVTSMRRMESGSTIKVYKTTKVNTPAQVGEGEVVPLTKFQRTLAQTINVVLKKYRKSTSGEAIQTDGFNHSVNETDQKMISEIGKEIKQGFFATINAGTGTAAAGATLQAAASQLWAAIQAGFEDIEVEGQTVFFVNPLDAAAYLGSAQITVQEAFGLQYIKNFLGMGTLIISKEIAQGKPVATVSDNLKGAYVAADGELSVFGYSFDDTGLIGVNHSVASDRVSIDTNAISGVKFYAEDLALVFKGTIGA